jgi:hypothetical protein
MFFTEAEMPIISAKLDMSVKIKIGSEDGRGSSYKESSYQLCC